ncbi:MAG: DUF669 domain-containing protein [Erysipelotrichaceae bacterium]
MDFTKFDQQVDTEKLAADAAEAAKNGGSYSVIPDGEYIVGIDKMEIGETKDGRPMFKVQFRILEGEYKKSCLFMNRVIFGTKNDAGMIGSVTTFLSKLEAVDENGDAFDCSFHSYSQLNDLVMDIMEAVEADELSYLVDYAEKAFNNVSIKEVFEG